ncbi:MAG: tripartite tricarboxylate transporter TctB family protein [Pseudolabrys sp.]|nr:tripartite tricarboxylate transporter TctB family protein [Pseudolabrys sp.]
MILRADHVAGGFFVAIGLGVIALSHDLPRGQLSMPGAGFLPQIVAVLIVVLGASLFLRAHESPVFKSIAWDDGRHAAKIILITGAAIALYVRLGFVVTMVLMMAALLVVIERKAIPRAFLYAVCIVIGTSIVFAYLVRAPLPAGVLGYW